MNNQLLLTRIINYLVLFSLVILIGCSGAYMYALQKTPKGYKSETFSRNMLFPNKVSDTELRYYNGNTFVVVDPATQKTKLLSTYKMLPDITQVFWLNNGVVFATQTVSYFSELQTTVKQTLVNDPSSRVATQPTYWYLSFKDNRIKPLTSNVVQPESFGVLATDNTFVFKDSNFSYSVLKESGEIIYGVVDMGSTESRPISATGDSLTYIAEGVSNKAGDKRIELKMVAFYKTEPTILSNDVFKDKTSTIYSQFTPLDDTHYLVANAKRDNKTGSDLYIYNRESGKRKLIIKDFDGVVTKVSGGAVAVKQGRTFNTIHLVTKDGVTTRLRINTDQNNTPAAAASYKNGFVISGLNGTAYLVSKDKASIESTKPSYSGSLEKEVTSLPNNLQITRNIESPYDTSYSLTFSGKPTDALNTLQQAITAKGYDPNQFVITLTPGRNAEF